MIIITAQQSAFSRLIFILTLIISGWLLSASPAGALDGFLENRLGNPLPEIEFMPRAEFEERTQALEITPNGYPELVFRVRIPKDWQEKSVRAGTASLTQSDVLSEISAYVSPGRLNDVRSMFKVKTQSLSFDIAAQHWFLQYIMGQAYNITGAKVHNPNKVEAIYVLAEGDVTYVVRVLAIRSGDQIVLTEFYVPQGQWQNERVLQAQSIAGFELLNPEDHYVQEIRDFSFLDIAAFSYPERWELRRPDITSTERMRARILNVNRELNILKGQVDIFVTSASVVQALEEELQKINTFIAENDMTLGSLIELRRDFNFHETMEFGLVEAYDVTYNKSPSIPYELWLAVMSSKNNYHFLVMVTPARNQDFTTWARNQGDFKIIVENTHPLVGTPGQRTSQQ